MTLTTFAILVVLSVILGIGGRIYLKKRMLNHAVKAKYLDELYKLADQFIDDDIYISEELADFIYTITNMVVDWRSPWILLGALIVSDNTKMSKTGEKRTQEINALPEDLREKYYDLLHSAFMIMTYNSVFVGGILRRSIFAAKPKDAATATSAIRPVYKNFVGRGTTGHAPLHA